MTADTTVLGDPDHLLQRLRLIASEEFGLDHVTIQLEQSIEGCEEVHHVSHDHTS